MSTFIFNVLIFCQVGARLISHAGSLTNLAKYPASTVQILGAEKALFRALKSRGKISTPKYGLIFHSTFIGRAGAKNKGRISRFLANKCSIASRIDCFLDSTSDVFGLKLKDQVEERLKFYETGDIPKKNIDVMKEASEENQKLTQEANAVTVTEKKKKKKDKKRKLDETNGFVEEAKANGGTDIKVEDVETEPVSKKKKKKNKAKQDE